jgi:hypothetical protein
MGQDLVGEKAIVGRVVLRGAGPQIADALPPLDCLNAGLILKSFGRFSESLFGTTLGRLCVLLEHGREPSPA